MPSVNVMTAPGSFARALMRALGLSARTVWFELRYTVNEVVTVKCEYHPDGDIAAGFDPRPLLAEYRLTVVDPCGVPVAAPARGLSLAGAIVLAAPAVVLLCAWLGGR